MLSANRTALEGILAELRLAEPPPRKRDFGIDSAMVERARAAISSWQTGDATESIVALLLSPEATADTSLQMFSLLQSNPALMMKCHRRLGEHMVSCADKAHYARTIRERDERIFAAFQKRVTEAFPIQTRNVDLASLYVEIRDLCEEILPD